MLRTLCVLLVGVTTSLSAGEAQRVEKPLGFATPEEAWEAYRHADHEARWRDAFRCMTPEGQDDSLVELLVLAQAFAIADKGGTGSKLKDIFRSNALNIETIRAESQKMLRKEALQYFKRLVSGVKDKETLYDEATRVVDPLAEHPKDKNGNRLLALGPLERVKIVGDQAEGLCWLRKDEPLAGNGGVASVAESVNVACRKINGRWYVNSRE